ncbi:hypothetical protein DYB37_003829 [Aphanomyces astaci]|uniref:Uncharacterized protein n=1 Tax=Aphanomyces astaci TaxID=112090 RepID=A0A3R7FCI5_APHAT|nr:hypothetical protein DYB35_006251 [Aphanomyces astaci]RHZ30681.1 hypothetical protein DYB37_003829 [Aphanomyces astaci]
MDSLDSEDTIHRPLLFGSAGYSSSQMLLDDLAFQQNREQHNLGEVEQPPPNPLLQGPLAPRLRLETLSSTAASAVLGLTYVAFCLAIVLPYLHTSGYLSKAERLSGELCSPHLHQTACTYIDVHPGGGGNTAWWLANVSNVSWLAGSMSLDMELRGVNVSTGSSFVLEYDVYVAPAMHASELALRTMLVVATLVWLPYWTYHTFERSSSSSVRPIQTRVLWLGLVLLVYQNPIFMFAQWFQSVSDATRFASDMCEAVATASWRVTWLFLMDHPLNAWSSWRMHKSLAFGLVQVATAASMCILRFPQLFAIGQHEKLFILLGVIDIGLTWTWLLWLRSICRRTMATLNDKLLYMTSRDHQLSYRFLFLELVLVMLYVGGTSVGHVAMLLREWVVYGTAPFLQAAVSSFSTRVVPLEHELFVSMVVYMAMVAHLPPAASASSTARFYIEEAHADASRQQQYPLASSHHHHFHARQNDHEDISNVFCLETAEWLVQLAWQAYMDPLGNPSASGNGVQALETFGFDLIVHLRHELLDTQAIVCMHRTKKRLVVAFRGSVSKAHWKTNLRFHQVPLWIHSLQGFNRHSRRSTCNDRALRWASRVPVLNLALPRVHSGMSS